MLKRGQVDADVEGDRKNRNAKPIKTRRAPKARKTKPQAADEEVSLPVNVAVDFFRGITKERSEEHTSELQSLMRTSYAVFCLKKKKKAKIRNRNHINKRNKSK